MLQKDKEKNAPPPSARNSMLNVGKAATLEDECEIKVAPKSPRLADTVVSALKADPAKVRAAILKQDMLKLERKQRQKENNQEGEDSSDGSISDEGDSVLAESLAVPQRPTESGKDK